jgi:hypothetical protein
MSGIFEKLGFNFDTNKFGDAQYLSPQAGAYLNAAPIELSSWQQQDIANGNVISTNYYQNPLANDCILIKTATNNIIQFIQTNYFEFAPDTANDILLPTANSLVIELDNFISHTDNISGVAEMTSNTDTIPSLDNATSIGNFLLRVVSVSDKIQNTTPLLGSMTSLFVGPEINSNVAIVNTAVELLNNSVDPVGTCTLTESQLLSINTELETLNNFIVLRRTSDWDFFTNATIIVMDTIKVSAFNNLGNTQTYLIENLIGTERLKNNLANTANSTI